MKLAHFKLTLATAWAISAIVSLTGCSLIPETRARDEIHNPFPQLKTVAVLPFFNQSDSPVVDGDAVGQAYYAALQSVPGFEVLPVGVSEIQLQRYIRQFGPPTSGADFQRLAKLMDVEAIVVGSVTDFDAYYPPRMAMTVRWYAANEGFHEIPPGYGLPWGTDGEEKIPARIVREAEFELARSQLKTQTPRPELAAVPPPTHLKAMPPNPNMPEALNPDDFMSPDDMTRMDDRDAINNPLRAPFEPPRSVDRVNHTAETEAQRITIPGMDAASSDREFATNTEMPYAGMHPGATPRGDIHDGNVMPDGVMVDGEFCMDPAMMSAPLPPDWPNPSDLIPDPPAATAPPMVPTTEPVLSQTRLYRGDDPYFTARLADYVETGDDARGSSWQGYVRRSEDFIRFCCHLHLTEMLEARGGRDPSDLILRWPVSRY